MKLPPETTDLRNFKWALQFGGLWWDRDMSLRDKIVYVLKLVNFTLFIALNNAAICLVPVRDIPYKPYSPLTLWYNSMYISTLYISFNSIKIVQFRDGMSKLVKKYNSEWEAQRFIQINSYLWKFGLYFMTWSMLGIFLLTFPHMLDLALFSINHSSVQFYLPFQMEGFLFGKRERSFNFYLFGFLNGLLQIIPLTYFVLFVVMLPAVVANVYFVLEVIERKLREWDNQHITKRKRKALMKDIVQDHVEILRLLEVMKSVLAPMYVMQLIIWCFNTGYYAHFARVAFKRGDLGLVLTQIYLTVIAGIGMFIATFIGQILYEKGLELSETTYNLIWYKKSIADQRDLQIVMLKVQKPVVIAFKTTFPLNYYTLTDLINRSYSIFMILGTIQEI